MFKYRMSVIVPVYNCEDYLASCLDSLLRQTISKDELEVLLIDDGSKDGSLGICKEYAEKHDIFKVFSLENGGVSATRNFGIEHSQGQYITYLDSDDTLTDNTLKTVADFFDRHFDEIDLVTYKIVPYYGEQKFALLIYLVVFLFFLKLFFHDIISFLTILPRWFIVIGNKMIFRRFSL